MSGQVGAPRDLYEQVRDDLDRIRHDWGDVLIQLDSIVYRPPWVPGLLDLQVEESTYDAISGGSYAAWDDLNRQYRLDLVRPDPFSNRSRVTLIFAPRLHPVVLAAEYARLPGVLTAAPQPKSQPRSIVHAVLEEDMRRYTFQHAWGTCTPPCDSVRYWEFHGVGTWVRFAGEWRPGDGTILRMSRRPGLGFCPEPDELLWAEITHGLSGDVLFTGAIAREGDSATGNCQDDPGALSWCLISEAIPLQRLTPRQERDLAEFLAAIPIEYHEINGACDPCLITRYEFGERVEEDNPCATASSIYEQAITDLELFLHEVVFGP
jgi:hypothetical protein